MGPVQEDKFTYPECWKDDMRMNALFAPFRAKSVNPTDWESKMKFWTSLIEQWCIYRKTPFVDMSVLCHDFRRKDKTPSCLNEVLNHLQSNKTLISKDAFLQMTEPSWKSWAFQVLVTNPLKWTLNKVASTIRRNENSTACIHYPALQKLGEKLFEKVPDSAKGKLLTMKHVQKISQINDTDVLQLLLQWLCFLRLAVLHQHSLEMVVKFQKTAKENLTVTDVDKALFSLEQNREMLQENINRLEDERDKLMDEARKSVADKKMVTAKRCLRRKKAVENVLKKMEGGAENVENLIYEIQMAKMDSVILDCYKTGVTALNKYFKDNGLTKENVMETKNELQEILTFKSGIDSILVESLDSEAGQDSDDLEEELRILLAENNAENEKTDDLHDVLDKLPEVPSETPEPVKNLEKKLAGLSLESS
ncbi:UNVERIFIED_CONTAM: hypothetical protein PYX00_007264 [Menopon gallinae]|uniref:Charged multivesicular body protein 7 n=1 Tax=Menopon gallinae TaxID=328185 RepID=A0AAW2HJ23_9NEOP